MGFLAFIQRKTQKLSQPQRKAPPYECRISPKSPVRLVHPTTQSTLSRSGSTYSHQPRPGRASLYPAHDVEPQTHSSPGLPLPRLNGSTLDVSSRPQTSLTMSISPAENQRPHTSLSNRRLSCFTSSGRSHIDLLDAQSEFKAPDFYGRVRASGARDYGEDVADRNLTISSCNPGSPLSQTFPFNSTVVDTTARTPRRHASLSSRASTRKTSEHNFHGRSEAALQAPRLTRKNRSLHSSSISSFAMESLAELDTILPPEMESHHEEGEPSVPSTGLRLEHNNSTDSFACPPPPIRRTAGSRASVHRSLSLNNSQHTPSRTEKDELCAVSSNETPSILFSTTETKSSDKRSTESLIADLPNETKCSTTETSFDVNDVCEDDAFRRGSEDTASIHTNSLRHWTATPLTPTISSSGSESTLRTPSRQAGNTSVDMAKVAPEPGSVSFDQLQMALTKGVKMDERETPGPLVCNSAFNIDDYLPDDESLLGSEEQPESEDLLFTPSYGKFELPGLQDMSMNPTSSNLLRSLEECVKTKPASEDDVDSDCPSLDKSKQRKKEGKHRPPPLQSTASFY